MKQTIQSVQERLALNSPHAVILGRKSRYKVEDLTSKGRDMMEKAEQGGAGVDEEHENENDKSRMHAILEDVMVELL